ncbi:hypothetical protein [Halopiger djelfimassiliensis]|uniref:hypothetical protein n=1 Tax=Halopiger djelfimassiliensis TaxID=1293047 RepID=UPI0006776CFB|nr:hypothetical protein [Halopiger djelfimassiliensis]
MNDFLRAMIVPFFAALFPAVWYVNRNLTTARLPPKVQPSTALVVAGLAVSVAVAAAIAFVVAVFRRRDVNDERTLPRYQRVFQPDDTSLAVFGVCVSLAALWAVVELAGIGPAWLGGILWLLLVPLGLPLVVLSPLAIQFHWALVLALVATVVWMATLATVSSDAIHRRRNSPSS